MSWFKGFFGGFAKGMAREMLKAALAEGITSVHQEIDKAEGTSPEEKEWMKKGVALLIGRLDVLVETKLGE